MNLSKLFEMQKVLRDRINYNEPDRFNKLILALLVELGECANEWRGFKFWSVNQIPHKSAIRIPAMMEEDKEYYNPLLEEYVDGLHFVLELGIEKEFTHLTQINEEYSCPTVEEQFIAITSAVVRFKLWGGNNEDYLTILGLFNGLAKMLGFTWEDIEQAYVSKNQVNHQRQEQGY
jgi:dimeric dUTPase (all-alpha-NTP-PPase superfamily)